MRGQFIGKLEYLRDGNFLADRARERGRQLFLWIDRRAFDMDLAQHELEIGGVGRRHLHGCGRRLLQRAVFRQAQLFQTALDLPGFDARRNDHLRASDRGDETQGKRYQASVHV